MLSQVAEAAITDLRVEGSLLVTADCPLGQLEPVSRPAPGPQTQLRGRAPGLNMFTATAAKENRMPDWDSFSNGV